MFDFTANEEVEIIENMVDILRVKARDTALCDGLEICMSLLGITENDVKMATREIPEI